VNGTASGRRAVPCAATQHGSADGTIGGPVVVSPLPLSATILVESFVDVASNIDTLSEVECVILVDGSYYKQNSEKLNV
jgi:hypothetical protein